MFSVLALPRSISLFGDLISPPNGGLGFVVNSVLILGRINIQNSSGCQTVER